jgi:hypothetical protein
MMFNLLKSTVEQHTTYQLDEDWTMKHLFYSLNQTFTFFTLIYTKIIMNALFIHP